MSTPKADPASVGAAPAITEPQPPDAHLVKPVDLDALKGVFARL